MASARISLTDGQPKVVGSLGGLAALQGLDSRNAADSCDLLEVRLDLLERDGWTGDSGVWSHLRGMPMLFTARRQEEGGALDLSAEKRAHLLSLALADAAIVDVEVASIGEMASMLAKLMDLGIPWIASFHDFEKPPEAEVLADAVRRAKDAGAAAFKVAARVHQPADLARLAEFQLTDHGIPVATMGMGPLAPVSRLLCAQCGSVLNYGYLGETPTAPGQWDASSLKAAIRRLEPFRL
jgi:3-dehydroquinate dehydratase-1